MTAQSPRSITTSSAPFSNVRAAFLRDLAGFSDTGRRTIPNNGKWTWSRPNREDFPVAELLLILMRDVMQFEWTGYEEKVRWTVYFNFDGEPMRIELAKFGLRFWYIEGSNVQLGRVIGQLQRALKRLEKHLMPLIDKAIHQGDATVANRTHEFRHRYEFFRNNATASFAKAERPARTRSKVEDSDFPSGLSTIIAGFQRTMKLRHEGFYHSVAMVDAYFSYLEHRLTLLRAFTGRALVEGGLETFLGAKWDEKLRMVLLQNDAVRVNVLLGRLRELKERIRNPFAHGGVENDRGSIFCHIPNVGAIPGNLSRTKKSARFRFLPVDNDEHSAACNLFDEVDALLCEGSLTNPSVLADGGVHPAWDKNSLRQYAELSSSTRELVEEYVSHWNDDQDRHENMDY